MDALRSAPELSEWSIGEPLGEGGMGAVYAATERATGEPRVVKVVRPDLIATDPRAAALFRREMLASRSLRHPNIVRTDTVGEAAGTCFIVMEYCALGSLADQASRQGPMSVAEAVPLFLPILDGLAYAHDAGFVHRDIKPHNILLSAADVAKIADFGLAKAYDTAGLSGLTTTGMAAGTPAFMPREQILNYKYVMPGVDVWAVAATLYYVLTGRTPRDFPPGRDPWLIVSTTLPAPVASRGLPVPPGLAAVIDQALDDTARLTFGSAGSLKTAIQGAWDA
ncbi:serine/threonine protein kinase [Streptosporangiaceae bacterium NEAU-GS5]|nr:serine/threonine protein kinase [Streptosporangiaceae bacterium NEAU-GS5]